MSDQNTSVTHRPAQAARQQAMAVLAHSEAVEIASRLAQLGDIPAARDVRVPECGLVMLRGRIGGDGPPFNLGEATVSRAAVRLPSGEMGFGYALGRDTERARLIALCDALLQTDRHEAVERGVIAPLREAQAARKRDVAEQVAATRVDFFTLVRGED